MPSSTRSIHKMDDDIFMAIAHPIRREILDQLIDKRMSASTIAEPFEASRSAISQHLTILVNAGLVERERQGREQVYHLKRDGLAEVSQWVSKFDRYWNASLDRLGIVLDELAEEENADNEA